MLHFFFFLISKSTCTGKGVMVVARCTCYEFSIEFDEASAPTSRLPFAKNVSLSEQVVFLEKKRKQ